MHKSQCSVPSVYSNGPSICSGGCGSVLACYACWLFSVFPSSCLSCSCVYISFCRLLSCCRCQFLSLFVPASFVPPARTRSRDTEALGEGVIRHHCRWLFASGSLSLGVFAALCLPLSICFSIRF